VEIVAERVLFLDRQAAVAPLKEESKGDEEIEAEDLPF